MIVVDDVFLPILVDYVVARCLIAESSEAAMNKAGFYFNLVDPAQVAKPHRKSMTTGAKIGHCA